MAGPPKESEEEGSGEFAAFILLYIMDLHESKVKLVQLAPDGSPSVEDQFWHQLSARLRQGKLGQPARSEEEPTKRQRMSGQWQHTLSPDNIDEWIGAPDSWETLHDFLMESPRAQEPWPGHRVDYQVFCIDNP